jgi:hypothetical protein
MSNTTSHLCETLRFGVYRPLTLDSVSEVATVAAAASARLTHYLAQEGISVPVEPRPDFGITFVSHSMMSRYLGPLAWGHFDLAGFVESINSHVRPLDDDIRVALIPDDSCAALFKLKHLRIRFVDEGAKLLQQRRGLQRVLMAHGGWPVEVCRPNHVSIANIGVPDDRPRLALSQRLVAKQIVTQEVRQAGLSTVRLGQLVVGTNYREPLPGTECP